jgi:hypothetical protein
MKSIDEQFKKCRLIFIQNKIIVPILLGLLVTAFIFGAQFSKVENRVTSLEKTPVMLENIQSSIDTLLYEIRK